jgi:hypothetical protein
MSEMINELNFYTSDLLQIGLLYLWLFKNFPHLIFFKMEMNKPSDKPQSKDLRKCLHNLL